MITTIKKGDLPNAKTGDPITLSGQVVGVTGDQIEIDVDISTEPEPGETAGHENGEPKSFEEMEEKLMRQKGAV